jgi:formylglycine-generating enzyme required for sulfatase activity
VLARRQQLQERRKTAAPGANTKAFEMGKYEVTQAQWKAMMMENQSAIVGDTARDGAKRAFAETAPTCRCAFSK